MDFVIRTGDFGVMNHHSICNRGTAQSGNLCHCPIAHSPIADFQVCPMITADGQLSRSRAVLRHHPHPRHDVLGRSAVPARPGGRQLRRARVGQGGAHQGRRTTIAPTTSRRPASRRCSNLLAAKLREKNGIPVGGPDEVMVASGGIHGLFAVCQGLLEPGDEVLVPDPAWPPAPGGILFARAVPVRYPLHESRGWRPDRRGDAPARSRRKTRAIYVNSPSNPTGGVLTRDDLEAIAELAARARPVGDLRRSLRGRGVRRTRTHEHRVAARHVRAHDSDLHVQQDVRDDRACGSRTSPCAIARFAIACERCSSTPSRTRRR